MHSTALPPQRHSQALMLCPTEREHVHIGMHPAWKPLSAAL